MIKKKNNNKQKISKKTHNRKCCKGQKQIKKRLKMK